MRRQITLTTKKYFEFVLLYSKKRNINQYMDLDAIFSDILVLHTYLMERIEYRHNDTFFKWAHLRFSHRCRLFMGLDSLKLNGGWLESMHGQNGRAPKKMGSILLVLVPWCVG